MIQVSKVYANLTQAREAIDRLKDAGFSHDSISLVTKQSEEHFPRDVVAETAKADATGEAAATGALAGIGIGALVGLAMVGTSIVLPGIGPVLIAGPLSAALAGAGAGGASGGLVGALVATGVPETEAPVYEHHLSRGAVIVSVRAENDQALTAREILEEVTTVLA